MGKPFVSFGFDHYAKNSKAAYQGIIMTNPAVARKLSGILQRMAEVIEERDKVEKTTQAP